MGTNAKAIKGQMMAQRYYGSGSDLVDSLRGLRDNALRAAS